MSKRWVGLFIGTLVSLSGACGGGDDPPATPPVNRVGAYCGNRGELQPCDAGYECVIFSRAPSATTTASCTKPCSTDADCTSPVASYVCGVGPSGARQCVPSCDSGNVVCVDGVATACSNPALSSQHCETCGCGSGERCQSDGKCGPLVEQGQACERDSDCKSDNCGESSKLCRVPVGSQCDASNCDRCMTQGTFSFCSRECTGGRGCSGDFACLGESSYYSCRPPCNDACPGSSNLGGSYQCKTATDATRFCACDNCTIATPPGVAGARCWKTEDCQSGVCLGDSTSGGSGYCSRECTSNSDCSTGFECGTVNCVSAEDKDCGKRCLKLCAPSSDCGEASCSAVGGVTGGNACLPRLPETADCIFDNDCQSGRCIAKQCGGVNGAANGASCGKGTDCASGNCQGGTCRGTALLGDKCTVAVDCSVGSCCSDGTCGNGC